MQASSVGPPSWYVTVSRVGSGGPVGRGGSQTSSQAAPSAKGALPPTLVPSDRKERRPRKPEGKSTGLPALDGDASERSLRRLCRPEEEVALAPSGSWASSPLGLGAALAYSQVVCFGLHTSFRFAMEQQGALRDVSVNPMTLECHVDSRDTWDFDTFTALHRVGAGRCTVRRAQP